MPDQRDGRTGRLTLTRCVFRSVMCETKVGEGSCLILGGRGGGGEGRGRYILYVGGGGSWGLGSRVG